MINTHSFSTVSFSNDVSAIRLSHLWCFPSCRWFGGYASWGPGQLQHECKEWAWFAAAASPDLMLQLPKESDGRDYWHTVRGRGVAGKGENYTGLLGLRGC